jgi:predicted transcriptional regulator
MEYRSRVEILTSILASSSEDDGVPISKVVQSYISYKHANECRTILIDTKLVERDKRTDSYTTNKRGLKFLNSINKVTYLLKRKEKESNSTRLTAASLLAIS